MKVKRMGITEILKRIWLFSAKKIKSSESVSKQPTQLIVELNSLLRHIIVTMVSNSFPYHDLERPFLPKARYIALKLFDHIHPLSPVEYRQGRRGIIF